MSYQIVHTARLRCVRWRLQQRLQCARWEQQWIRRCREWEQRQEQRCTRWEQQQYQRCDRWETERRRECASWHWLFRWLCVLFTWITTTICRVWTWVTTTICRVWTWVTTTICRAWTWLLVLICTLWVLVTSIICDLWAIVFGPQSAEILPVHAALLRTGKVLYFSGSQHIYPPPSVDATRLWDIATFSIQTVPSPRHDLFCSGHAFLADGKLLVSGGTQQYDTDPDLHHDIRHFRGLRNTVIFDPGFMPGSNPWQAAAPMIFERGTQQGGGRWYPTLVTLGDGRVFAMSGHPEDSDSRHNNITLETFDPTVAGGGSWTDQGDKPEAPDSYPRLYVLPNGEVFSATPMNGRNQRWNPVNRLWTDVAPEPGAGYGGGIEWSSALLPLRPPNYRTCVLVVGQADARIIDLGDGGQAVNVNWSNTGARTLPAVAGRHPANPVRQHCIAVILPDRKILVVGGTTDGTRDHAVLAAELYDPDADVWTTLGSSTIPRGYHAVALLLPDGQVWVGGSDFSSRSVADKELRLELFAPPYMSAAARPTINSAPANIGYGVPFTVQTNQASTIASVALVRCGSITHAFNADQRYVELQIIDPSTRGLAVLSPPDGNVAPPGVYLLFILNQSRIPSVGRFITLA